MAFFDLVESPSVVVPARSGSVASLQVQAEAYEVTGISPQSRTVAHELKGLVSNGTL